MLVIFGTFFSCFTDVNAKPTNDNQVNCDTLEAMFITLLNPLSVEIILERIGGQGMSYSLSDAKILDIERPEVGGFRFITTIRYNSYTGPHNPPYGIEILTYDITASGAKLLNYTHKIIN
ncbi:DUF3888 domain-containing protein [Paenibacillus sp. NEAU-GSW1]|uniref:DUF3888 domain-containing protein n=1 Tax=Paenibacillus sp. NEAU-GSW1 TaxID=2682486 RepID=UPI001564CF4B|nr:DUF3888 domain-containing protein [Paenibacillus sp. NEAU-GSW1]